MNFISRNDLRQLAKMNGEYVVSIYMPASVGAESRQNPIRFRNLLRLAGQKMRDRKIGEPAIQKMTVSAHTLIDQPDFWQELSHGLAVFVSRDSVRAWPLPFICEESCRVGQHAHLLPLLAWVVNDAPYFVLAVSQNAVRLLHGTRAQLVEFAAPNLPANLAEALHYDPRQGTLQMHSGQPRRAGKEGVVFHGQGGEVDVAKQELTSYFREIDRVVCDCLQQRTEPLVFAGVDYLFPIYQAVNSYSNLASTPIVGNPDLLSPAEIGKRAWPLVGASIRDGRQAEWDKYWNAVAHGRTSNCLEDIIVAANAGTVETLFVELGARQIGSFVPDTAIVRCDKSPKPDSEDLVNLAATLVLQSNGWVEVADTDGVPGGGMAAAIVRYAATPANASTSQQQRANSAR